MKYSSKTFYPVLFTMLLVAILISYLTSGSSAAQTATATPPGTEAATVTDLMDKMGDEEYALFQKAEETALQIRLEIYKYFMQQRTDSPLTERPTMRSMTHHVADIYGQLLLLRVETILEIKRRWPDYSVEDLVDMMQYSPKLILAIADDIDQMLSLEGLDLNWEQKKSVSTNWFHLDVQSMETTHRISLILLDLKAALTDRVPERSLAVEQVTAIVALQHKWIDEEDRIRDLTWDLLSPSQREKWIHLVKVAIRTR